jgi:hypothetical protein
MIVVHQIAGITVRTESDVPIPYLLSDSFVQFQVDNVEPDVHCWIRQLDPDDTTPLPPQGKERAQILRTVGFPKQWLDKLILRSRQVRAVLQPCLEHPERVHIELRWNRAIIRDLARNEIDLFYPPSRRKDFSKPIVVAGYRNLLVTFPLNHSALLIHGAGVVRNGAAALFLAPDGGGKTAVVRSVNGATVLNDDHVVLQESSRAIIAHGTPFGQITGGPVQARVGGLFLLEKSIVFELIPAKRDEVLQFLWNEHMLKWHMLPKDLRTRAFNILYDACHQAPVYRMRFPKDYVDWDAIDAAMER